MTRRAAGGAGLVLVRDDDRRAGAPDALAGASEPALDRAITLAFAPLHKRAFGVAIGITAAIALVALTVADAALDVDDRFPLGLLSVYLRGYEPTPAGVALGAVWALGVGFVAGWFAAFVRNLVLAVALAVARARVRWLESHDVLDHL